MYVYVHEYDAIYMYEYELKYDTVPLLYTVPPPPTYPPSFLLPLEYELYTQLLQKLRLSAMNSVFGLSVQIAVGDAMVLAVATGTAIFLAALPAPRMFDIPDGPRSDHVVNMLGRLGEMFGRNARAMEAARRELDQEMFVGGAEKKMDGVILIQ